MFGFGVMPEGSNRVFSSLSTNTLSGTPYCNPSEIVRARASIFVHADGEVAFVPTHAELVRHRGALGGHFLALSACKEFALHRFAHGGPFGFLLILVLSCSREGLRALRIRAVDAHSY